MTAEPKGLLPALRRSNRGPGYRASWGTHHSVPGTPIPDRSGWFTFGPETADYFFVCPTGTLDDLGEHFASEDEVKARVKELNEADAIASLGVPEAFRERFERYRKLHSVFRWWMYDGKNHPLTRLPARPDKYAVAIGTDDGDSYWTNLATLDDVRAEIEGGDVGRVVDLDTGKDVPFTRTVQVEIQE